MRTTTRFTLTIALCLTGLAEHSAAQLGNNTEVLNPNLAQAKQLTAVTPMTEAMVSTLVAARPLASNQQMDQLLSPLLSDEARAKVRGQVFLPVNLNTATEQELHLVPGINRKMVHEFEEYRPYTSLEQFRKEMGKYVSAEEVARYEQYVFIPLDLNSASSEALASIPGMNRKMVHEFEEYRPYTSMDQFRREIGKYVDENEVARLERYVIIR
ncbi:MAG: helix-hairpin-helix domain-containing protein [Lysobacterales bacterium]